MTAQSLKAGALVAAVLALLGPAKAADLDYRNVPRPDRYSQAYEDPRYRDLYGHDRPPPRLYDPRPAYGHVPAPYAPVPPAYVYRDAPPGRFVDWDRRDDWRHASGCLPRQEIRRRLVEDGWGDFHDLELARDLAVVKARRPNGDLFELKVDRCSGDLVKTVLVDREPRGPYAGREDWRRGPRPYY